MNNKPTIKLTFDVELWTEGAWMQSYITEDLLKSDPFPASIAKILNALKAHDAHATFFVTLEVTEKYPYVLRNIVEAGHEIGVHGPKHIRLRDYTPESFRSDLVKQLSLIESATSAKAEGFRAAHFSLEDSTMWILPILRELGFSYDSSIFPINMGEYGISNTPLKPYEIIPGLQEIPTSVASFFGFRIPFAGGIYFRLLPLFIFKFLLKNSAKHSTPVIYFHPHELDVNTPQIKIGPWLRRKLKYFGTKKSFEKFEALLKSFQCIPIDLSSDQYR